MCLFAYFFPCGNEDKKHKFIDEHKNEEPYAAAIGGEITKDTFGIQVAKMKMPVGRMNEVWRAYVDER